MRGFDLGSSAGRWAYIVFWIVLALGAGITLAYFKLHIMIGAITDAMCGAVDTCEPASDKQGAGVFYAFFGLLNAVLYPISLAAALFLPRHRSVMIAMAAVLVICGFAIDALGFIFNAALTMLVSTAAWSPFFWLSVGFAAAHLLLMFVFLGRAPSGRDAPDPRLPSSRGV
jgi:hypothetical protein